MILGPNIHFLGYILLKSDKNWAYLCEKNASFKAKNRKKCIKLGDLSQKSTKYRGKIANIEVF